MKRFKYCYTDNSNKKFGRGQIFKIEEWTSKRAFLIRSPITNNMLYCLKDNCSHLGGGNWMFLNEIEEYEKD